MRKGMIVGLAALGLWLISTRPAAAWVNASFGVGIGFSFQHGGGHHHPHSPWQIGPYSAAPFAHGGHYSAHPGWHGTTMSFHEPYFMPQPGYYGYGGYGNPGAFPNFFDWPLPPQYTIIR